MSEQCIRVLACDGEIEGEIVYCDTVLVIATDWFIAYRSDRLLFSVQ